MHVLSLPPAFALSQDQTLKLYSRHLIIGSVITFSTLRHRCRSVIDGVHIGTTKAETSEAPCELPEKRVTAEVSFGSNRSPIPQGPRRPRFPFFLFTCQRARSCDPGREPQPTTLRQTDKTFPAGQWPVSHQTDVQRCLIGSLARSPGQRRRV